MKNVIGAKCIKCGTEFEAGWETYTCTKCGGILDIVFDYNYIKRQISQDKIIEKKDFSMWRYMEFLPVDEGSILCPLRTGWSPLYRASLLGKKLGLSNLYIKDDGQNPTSSLKDRASGIAVVRAFNAGKSLAGRHATGINTSGRFADGFGILACSSTGNAASSLAGAAASMGLKTVIFVPQRAPQAKVTQLLIFGATVVSVKGDYATAFRLSAQAIEKYGWYNRNAAINPYLMEGKKTVSFEIAEQLGLVFDKKSAFGFISPDFVAVSVGDGCTIAGVWKGFKDLFEAGLIDKLPRLISVQAEGCCPINRAIEHNAPVSMMEENSIADSIAVGIPRNADKAMAAIRESGGIVVNVSDEEILAAMRLLGKSTGVFGEPAGVAGTAGLIKAVQQKLIPFDALVVSIVTGNGLKDINSAQKAAGSNACSVDNANLSGLIQIEPDINILDEELLKRRISH